MGHRVQILGQVAPAVAARAEDSRLQSMLDSVADAIVIFDPAGRIGQWNAGAERIFGYAAHEMIGKSIALLAPLSHRAQTERALQGMLDAGQPPQGASREMIAVHKGGKMFPIEFTLKEGLQNGERFITGIARDITRRKQNEADLIAARRQAEDASVAKSQFLATMSHEIRTPMNGVLGMANLLSMTALNARQSKLVESLLHSGQSLLGVINDILDFSKIEAGRMDLFEVDFDLREVMAEISDLYGQRCAAKGLEFVYFIAENIPAHLRGDPARLRQILVNLVDNAVKFTERGEILVEVTLQGYEDGHAVLAFTVQDSGIGIAAEQRQLVFGSFHQVDGSMTRARGGSGLGLAITRRLVEMMGGAIEVESELGRFSRFRFTARFAALLQDRAEGPRQVSRALRVLLVDNNAVSSHILQLYLASWHLDVAAAESAAEAQALWAGAATPFDVAIIDIKGLGESARDLLRKFKAAAPQIKFILLAGLDKPGVERSLEALGAFAIFGKPARPSELFNALAAIAAGNNKNGVKPFYARRNASLGKLRFGARILVVEDNEVNQEVVQGMLQNFGCTVVTAVNGADAVERFAKEKFDLVLMDCEMPVMNGFDATSQIRALESPSLSSPRGRRIPIVALTAHALGEVRQCCEEAGMDDFVVKPFDGLQLSETLKRWLESDGEAAAVEEAAEDPCDEPPSMPGASALDVSAIEEIRKMGGPAGAVLVGRVVSQYLSGAPRLAATIRDAAQAGDCDSVWRAAHTFKSSSGTLGARRLAAQCLALEQAAKLKNLEGVRALLPQFGQELGEVLDALQPFAGAAS